MPLLTPSLRDALLCPACATTSWADHVDPGSESTGTIECTTCRRHYLVVETIPVLRSALDSPRGPMKLGDRVRRDSGARALLKQALGRFHDIFGSVERALAACSEGSLEEAFTIPQAPWINLSRFSWPKFKRVVELCGAADTVIDLGCGYGPSAASFVSSGSVRSVIGIDENLYLLLLFRRYAREHGLNQVALLCSEVGVGPMPLHRGTADAASAISFFNHFACLKGSRELRSFFKDLSRVVRPGGRLVVDMVPNRRYPFPTEINFELVIPEERFRTLSATIIRRVPLRWLPGTVTIPSLWGLYRLHAALRRLPAVGFSEFRHEVSKALPEAAVGGLPLRVHSYRKLLAEFSEVEVLDEAVLDAADKPEAVDRDPSTAPYFLIRCSR